VFEQTADLLTMSESQALWLAALRSYSLIRLKKKADPHGGRGSGNNPGLFWPETERITPLCPQEWQRYFSELDSVGMGCPAIKAGRPWLRSSRGNESGGQDRRAAW